MENNSLYLENKLPFTYNDPPKKAGIAACLLLVVAAVLLCLAGIWWWPHPLFYTSLPLLFFLAGVVHVFLMNQYLPAFRLPMRWLFTSFLALLAGGLLSLIAVWDENLLWLNLLSCSAAFFLPFTIKELWQSYADLSFSQARYWQISGEENNELPAIYLKSIKVRFKVIQEPAVSGTGVIPVTASARMPLRDVFFSMVQKQNRGAGSHIALRSRELEPYTWIFYKMDFYFWYRILDPEKSIQDNSIGKNSLIYAQRVSGESFTEPAEEQIKPSQK